MNTIRIGFAGFGNAAKAFCNILLTKREQFEASYGYQVQVIFIATATRGNLLNTAGIDLKQALWELTNYKHFREDNLDLCSMTTEELISSADYDVLFELTPLNIVDGQPAINYIQTAIKRKKHVITANKGPLAYAAKELQQLAKANNVQFLFETTVMDGTPVFNLVAETLPCCKVIGFEGILNTTTNFILEQLAKGKSFEEALAEGKQLGFVEADPSNDIDGHDAAAKTAVLMNVLMNAAITPSNIESEGIANITVEEILEAQQVGQAIKLLCQGTIKNGKPQGIVRPEALPFSHPLAGISGTSSALTIHTDLMGSITIIENNPLIEQTGYGLFSDLVRLILKIKD